MAKNSGFDGFMGDSQLLWGVPACQMAGRNPELLATAKCSGLFFEIFPFEKAHGLSVSMNDMVEKI